MTDTLRTNPDRFARDVLGVRLHAGQVEFLSTPAKVKVACCGRRWGKSYSTSVDLIHFAVMHAETQQFLIAPTHDQAGIIFRYVERMLRGSAIAELVAKVVYSPFPEIRLQNGAVIRARSAGHDATNVRGHGADRIVMDEAAFIPQAVYETVTPLLANSAYGELVLISTPFGMNHFYEYWTRGQDGSGEVRSFRFPTSSSPYVTPRYLEQQRREMTQLAYQVEYEAAFAEDQNAVFPWSLIETCLADEIDVEPQADHRYVLGYDPAKYSDRSGVAVLDITDEPWRVLHTLDISGRDYLTQAAQIETLCRQYHDAPVLLDATSHDQMLEHLLAKGVRAFGYRFTNESKRELIDGLVLTMERAGLRFPRYPALLDELKYYRYELTASGNVKLGADDAHHDDLVTALALAVHQAKIPQAGILFAGLAEPTPPSGSFAARLKSKRR